MGLLQKAVETYDCHLDYASKNREGQSRMAPVGHIVTRAELEITLDAESVQAPVEAGQALGKLILTYEGQELGSVDLVAVSAAERSELLYRLDQIGSIFRLAGVKLVFGVLVLVLAVLILRRVLLRPRSRYGSRYSGRRRNYTGRRRR